MVYVAKQREGLILQEIGLSKFFSGNGSQYTGRMDYIPVIANMVSESEAKHDDARQ